MAVNKNTIPPERLKLTCNTSLETLTNFFNECLTRSNFSDNLKLADIIQFLRRKFRQITKTVKQSVASLLFLKRLKNLWKSE